MDILVMVDAFMHRAFYIFLLLLSCLMFQSCESRYKDISDDANYASIVNKQFVLNRNLKITGFTLDKKLSNRVDRYSVKTHSFAGREVISTNSLHIGMKFVLVRVLSCSNCLTGKIKFEITFTPKQFEEAPILMDDFSIKIGNSYKLNPEMFKQVIEN